MECWTKASESRALLSTVTIIAVAIGVEGGGSVVAGGRLNCDAAFVEALLTKQRPSFSLRGSGLRAHIANTSIIEVLDKHTTTALLIAGLLYVMRHSWRMEVCNTHSVSNLKSILCWMFAHLQA